MNLINCKTFRASVTFGLNYGYLNKDKRLTAKINYD